MIDDPWRHKMPRRRVPGESSSCRSIRFYTHDDARGDDGPVMAATAAPVETENGDGTDGVPVADSWARRVNQ